VNDYVLYILRKTTAITNKIIQLVGPLELRSSPMRIFPCTSGTGG
jgi:hypothetical protein